MFRPILVDHGVVQNQVATEDIAPSSGVEIVQWRPCLHALALQLWPYIVEARHCASRAVHKDLSVSENAIPLQESGLSLSLGGGSQSPRSSGSASFEFQMGQFQPSPPVTRGRKNWAATIISLPTVACDTSIPLVEGSVRRSTRLNKTDGFCPVRLNREPTKKRKICVVQIDEKTSQARPVSIPVL